MVHITSPTFTMQVCICPYLMLCRYYVNRDTLFCYHKASEAFLQRLMALYVASHYKVIVDCSPLTLIYCALHSVVIFVIHIFVSRIPQMTCRCCLTLRLITSSASCHLFLRHKTHYPRSSLWCRCCITLTDPLF